MGWQASLDVTPSTTKPSADRFAGALNVYKSRLKNARIALEKMIRADQPMERFEGDIPQVIGHLVTNAIDAMPLRGRLLLRSRNATDWRTGRSGVILIVADTGIGIPRRIQPKIFEAFFTTKEIGGTGLGLWISAEIIGRHQGSLNIRSSQQHDFQGTVARVFLPFEKKPCSKNDWSSKPSRIISGQPKCWDDRCEHSNVIEGFAQR
ncbi:MAG TPA: HAMP domain-containing sensor histidine kinase [Edaphobacter sp.]|nr:HAMP domain-containing sensor histidine kinase [Edaphobacter sp.]